MNKTPFSIRGAGGDSGNNTPQTVRPPEQDPDNLNSIQYATFVDLISEGEIEGLKDGYKSIFIENTPLQNADGTFNYGIRSDNVSEYIETRNGTQVQSSIAFAAAVEDEKSVNVQVKNSAPITRSITDRNVDAVRVTLSVPQLQVVRDNGDIRGSTVVAEIYVQYNGGGFTRVVQDAISGRTNDPYQRDYIVKLNGAFPVDIKVVRETLDDSDTNPNVYNNLFWQSYTEITYAKLKYPNSALVAMRLSATQFNNIPSRSYLVRGIKVAIPSNATVDSNNGRLIYSGAWDGTFGAAQWTTDPAWILWDLLTSTRYGFGDHITSSQLDKWAFFSASQYSSALVSNGLGGFEPRFSCNVNIQTQEDAYKLINDMCSVFRVMPYWSTGALTISQDKAADWAYLFTLANVTEAGFAYEGSSRKVRPTVAVVSYLDLELRDIAYEVVEDEEGIAKYGVVKSDISAFACTSRGQAARIGKWLLYSEKYEGETVTFTTSVDAGVLVRPGQLIKISDPVKAGTRRGGRIRSATTTAITVDDATGLTTANSPQLNVILPDGTVEQRSVTSVVGNVITVSSAFTTAPNPNSVWLYGTTNIQTSTWRVLGIQEQDGTNYSVTALAYNPSKYGYVEDGKPLSQRDITDLNVRTAIPTGLNASEVLYEEASSAKAKIILTWQPVTGVAEYQVQWRLDNDNWYTLRTNSNEIELLDTTVGEYQFKVWSFNSVGLPSLNYASYSFNALGKTEPPETPTGLNLLPNSESTAILSWARATSIDVLLGGKVLIRHSTATTGATWASSQQIIEAAAGSQTQKQVPLLEGTYFIKFEDDTGNQSTTAASVVVDLPEPQDRLLVESYREKQNYYTLVDDFGTWDSLGTIDDIKSATFPGTKTNLQYDAGINGLKLTNTALGTGEYTFYNTLNMGGVFDVNLRRYIVANGFYPTVLWDSQTALIDTWPDIDGSTADQTDALMYVRTTQTDPTGSPTWSAWSEFSNVLVRGWGFQFKVVASTTNAAQNIEIDELGVDAELQQRIEQAGPLTTSTSAASFNFNEAFYAAPIVGITSYGLEGGEAMTLSSVTKTSFALSYSQDGEGVPRAFSYTAVGYGKRIS